MTAPNTKARSQEIQAAAVKLIEPVDVSKAVEIRPLAHKLVEVIGCEYSTAKRHIARAVRRARGEIVKGQSNWGGPRPGAGYPKGQPRKAAETT